MKLRYSLALLATTFVMLRPSLFAEPTPSVFPHEPLQLLAVLPTAPTDWKLTRSAAETSLAEWPQTIATRAYEAPPPPPDASGNPAPGTVEIAIVDTAGFAPALASFANFQPVKSDGFEKRFIGALPAIVAAPEPQRQFTEVLVSSRYLVQLTLTNLPKHRAEDWLRLFRFDTLPAKSPAPTSQLRDFRLTEIDELNPARSRSYTVSVASKSRLDAFLKTLPPEPESDPQN